LADGRLPGGRRAGVRDLSSRRTHAIVPHPQGIRRACRGRRRIACDRQAGVGGPGHAGRPDVRLAQWIAHPRHLHFLERCRLLAAAALGYRVDAPPRWNLQPPAAAPAMPTRPYAVLLHGTSRDDKLWPETHWRELEQAIAQAGLAIVLPWGSPAEEARSRRLAQGFADAVVPPWLSLPDAAALLANAALAIGVDTGFTHLAAALGTPTMALFSVTDAARHGVACAGSHAQDLGDRGAMPSAAAVVSAARTRLATLG
jgi:heptosyltransferase-1